MDYRGDFMGVLGNSRRWPARPLGCVGKNTERQRETSALLLAPRLALF